MTTSEHNWLDAVDNDPASLRIYGDWLMEQGNPVGYIIAELDNVQQYKQENNMLNLAEWFERRYNSLAQVVLNSFSRINEGSRVGMAFMAEKLKEICDHNKERVLDELIDTYVKELTNFPVALNVRHRWEILNRRRPSTPGMNHVMLKCHVFRYAISAGFQGPHLHVIFQRRGRNLGSWSGPNVTEMWDVTSEILSKDIRFHGIDGHGVLIPLPDLKLGDKVPPIKLAPKKWMSVGQSTPPLISTRTYKFLSNNFGLTPQIPISRDPKLGYQAIEINEMELPVNGEEDLDYSVFDTLMTADITSRRVRDEN